MLSRNAASFGGLKRRAGTITSLRVYERIGRNKFEFELLSTERSTSLMTRAIDARGALRCQVDEDADVRDLQHRAQRLGNMH